MISIIIHLCKIKKKGVRHFQLNPSETPQKMFPTSTPQPWWQMLRMHGAGGKLLNGIKSMYVDNLACVRVKWDEIIGWDKGVPRPLDFSMYIWTQWWRWWKWRWKERSEWKLHGLLYADDLVLYGESGEDLRAMVGCFVEVCRRRGMSKMMGLNRMERRD